MTSRPRVLYILNEYPQLSETYIQTEIDAIKDRYEIRIISTRNADQPPKHHDPYETMAEPERIAEVIQAIKPDILHAHWMTTAPLVGKLSREFSVPFTLRAHSFDVLWKWKELSLLKRLTGRKPYPKYMTKGLPYLKDDLCLGVLSFPFGRPNLEKAGLPAAKIFDVGASINYKRFHDTSPNGDRVMNGGAALPKKKMDDFIELATLVPQRKFDLYPIGYKVEDLKAINAAKGNPVNILPSVEPTEMPPVYKQHQWLVYTGSMDIVTTGWPVMCAEAQAAGVGVVLKNLRPDMKEYIGPCGFVFDTIADAAKIISQPFPEELRQMGFEHARKSDIEQHKRVLTDLWDSAIHRKTP